MTLPIIALPIGYIGPDLGLPFMSAWGAIAAVLLAVLGVVLTPFKFFWKGMKKGGFFGILLGVMIVVGLVGGGVYYWLNLFSPNLPVRVIVIGMDGLDPALLEEFMGKGLLPNFQRLRDEGSYSRLGTTNPALSPVAWSSFITGANPGRHGVFDFLKRNPKTYLPDLTFTDIEEPKPVFQIGNFKFSLSGPRLKTHRKGVAFWDITSQHRIPTTVVRTPTTFPPDKIHGRMLSGFGVPDLRGGQGTFSFYSTDLVETGVAGPAGGQIIEVKSENNVIQTELVGPRDRSKNPPTEMKVPFSITVHPDQGQAAISLQGKAFDLGVGKWSEWQKVSFQINPWTKASGMVRFYLTSITPQFNLYVSPINFDPRHPAFPISHPGHYAKELAEHIGLFHTIGQAEDTWSLNEGRVSEDTFLEQSYQVIHEREAMLFHELNRFEKGLLVTVFDTPDRIQHMFWRLHDPGHPLYDPELVKKYEDVFPKLYQTMDRILGDVMKFADDKTVVMVLSDHGFSEFRTAVHMNRWLAEAGFLKFSADAPKEKVSEFFQDVDWSQTQAYSVGLAGIYLNRAGRERDGIVTPEQAAAVTDEIIKKLLELIDPTTGKRVVKRVYRRDEIYNGPYVSDAPDLVVGFEEGYRFSWQTALGGTPPVVFEPNQKRWSGDHCVDPSFVSGVLLVNRKIQTTPSIIDIGPTLLKLFEIEVPASMDGKSIL